MEKRDELVKQIRSQAVSINKGMNRDYLKSLLEILRLQIDKLIALL